MSPKESERCLVNERLLLEEQMVLKNDRFALRNDKMSHKEMTSPEFSSFKPVVEMKSPDQGSPEETGMGKRPDLLSRVCTCIIKRVSSFLSHDPFEFSLELSQRTETLIFGRQRQFVEQSEHGDAAEEQTGSRSRKVGEQQPADSRIQAEQSLLRGARRCDCSVRRHYPEEATYQEQSSNEQVPAQRAGLVANADGEQRQSAASH